MIEIKTKFVKGMQFEATTGCGHKITMDTHQEKGGTDAGPTPMELVLTALTGCTGIDVVAILRKMKIEPEGLEIWVQGERREEYPQIYKKTHLTYIFYGEVPNDKAKLAIDKSIDKYCPIASMIKGMGEMSYDFKVISKKSD